MDGRVFHNENEVRYAETDASGYVHQVNYLTWLDCARDEFFVHMGVPYSEFEDRGFMLPMIRYDIEFDRPVRFGDVVDIYSAITGLEPKRLTITHEILRKDGRSGKPEHVCTAVARMAIADRDAFKSTDLQERDPQLYQMLAGFLVEGDLLQRDQRTGG